MKRIDRYVAAAVLGGTGIGLAVLMAVYAVVELMNELGNLGEGDYGVVQMLTYVSLILPEGVYDFFPIAVLIGALLGLGNLSANRELMVMRSAGLSVTRLSGSALLAGVVLMPACFALGEWVMPRASDMATELRTAARLPHASGRVRGFIWVRDGNRYININFLQSRGPLRKLQVYEFDDQGRLRSVARADRAHLTGDGWQLGDVVMTKLEESGTEVVRHDQLIQKGDLNPKLLELFVVKPRHLSTIGLSRYIGYLEENGLETMRYTAAFWRKVVAPFTVLAMILLAVPVVLGPLSSVGTGQRMFAGVIAGLAYFLLDNAVVTTGTVYGMPIAVLAWLPTLGVVALAWWAMRHTP